MLTLTKEIVCDTCPTSGEIGFRLKEQLINDAITLDAGTGELMAHDLIEHINGVESIGGIADELEAFGVSWAVLGSYAGELTTADLGNEIYEIFRYFEGLDNHFPIPRTLKCEHDESFEHAIAAFENTADEDGSGDDEYNEKIATFSKLAMAHMRIGYRKFKRKYQTANWAEDRAYENYQAIIRAVQETKDFDIGDEFVLKLNRGHCEMVKVELEYDYED